MQRLISYPFGAYDNSSQHEAVSEEKRGERMASHDEAEKEFARASGKETTWVLQCDIGGDWKTFAGIFQRTVEDAVESCDRQINSAMGHRTDITGWRLVDTDTDSILWAP